MREPIDTQTYGRMLMCHTRSDRLISVSTLPTSSLNVFVQTVPYMQGFPRQNFSESAVYCDVLYNIGTQTGSANWMHFLFILVEKVSFFRIEWNETISRFVVNEILQILVSG